MGALSKNSDSEGISKGLNTNEGFFVSKSKTTPVPKLSKIKGTRFNRPIVINNKIG